MFPPDGSSRRLRQRKKVDFPEPDGPIITRTSPFSIEIFMSFKT